MTELTKPEDVPLPDRYIALVATKMEYVLSRQAPDGKLPSAAGMDHFSTHDQNAIHALAFLYATEHPQNPWTGDARVLEATVRLGDFIAAQTNETGGFTDNPMRLKPSTHVDQWLCQAWLESLLLLADELDAERAAAWRTKLHAAGASLAETVREWVGLDAPYHTRSFGTSPNHAITRAAFLYRVGVVFDEPAWCALADRFVPRFLAMQDADGCWPEYAGPVILYAMVSLCGIGQYYEYTGNAEARAAIERTIPYLACTRYPDGGPIALLDGRQQHTVNHATWGQFALSLTPEGRALCDHLTRTLTPTDAINGMALHRNIENYRHYHDGPVGRIPLEEDAFTWRMQNTAGVRKQGPWMWALSGIVTRSFVSSPFSVDRQSCVSVYHASVGRVLNGANSKNSPAAATFACGTNRIDFLPRTSALDDEVMHLDVDYDRFRAAVTVRPVSATELELSARLLRQYEPTVFFRLQPMVPYGTTVTLDADARELDDNAWEVAGVRELSWDDVTMRFEAPVRIWWPFEGFNSYSADNTYPDLKSARLIVETELSDDSRSTTVRVEIRS